MIRDVTTFPSAILAELDRLAPEVVSDCRVALEQVSADLDFLGLEREAFAACPNVTIAVAVMEKSDRGAVLSLQGGQGDVGSWRALCAPPPPPEKHDSGNVLRGRVNSEGNNNYYTEMGIS